MKRAKSETVAGSNPLADEPGRVVNVRSALLCVLYYLGILAIVLVFLFPFYWMVTAAFKLPADVTSFPPKWVFTPTLQNFVELLEYDVIQALANSVIVVGLSTLAGLLIGTMAAYALARFDIKGRDSIALDILSIRMLPPIVTVIPLFVIAKKLGLLDTHFLLVAIYTLSALPFVVWVMRVFIEEIPRSIEEAALIDGCTRLGALFRVTVPMMLPGLAATVVIVSMFAWNEYLFASLLTSSTAKTLPVMASITVKPRAISWGVASAAGVIMSLPVIVVAFAAQKYLVRGITFGVVKG